jgi:hypothetical protein
VSDDGKLWITSIRGPDDEPVCQLTWHGQDWYPTVAEVRETALDLFTCAAYAEMMRQMIAEAGLPPGVVEQFMMHLLRDRAKRYFGAKGTVELMPAGAVRKATGQRVALVLITRGGHETEGVSPDKARTMGLGWLAVAEATESDQLVTEALTGLGVDRRVQERLFGYLLELRKQ